MATANDPAVDAYLAACAAPARERLEALRAAIRVAAPAAEECLSYRMPAYRLRGKPLAYYAAFARHVGYYPTSGPIAALEAELAEWPRSKGALRFPHDRPLPLDLVAKLVAARVAEIERG